ncbi:MAG: hypothetical protein EXS10_05630 [Phycisphaerales bacterium]|nr:hypothetical protein [Phycisphaerales bacterium]
MSRARRAGILLELLLSLALFVAGATVIIATVRGSNDGVRRAAEYARADDLACSRLIELDAGLVAMDELRGASSPTTDVEFTVSIVVEPTAVAGLVRAIATVHPVEGTQSRIIVERDRLVRLRNEEVP